MQRIFATDDLILIVFQIVCATAFRHDAVDGKGRAWGRSSTRNLWVLVFGFKID